MRIALLGYMGSGKTTVGTLLAEKLHLPFIDLDRIIEKREQQSIADIFNTKGEAYFRLCEAQELSTIIKEASAFVLATGGGTPCFHDNMNLLNEHCTTFFLNCSAEEIRNRVTSSTENRPLFNSDLTSLQEHLSSRIPTYTKAHYTIDNFSSAEATCASILKVLVI